VLQNSELGYNQDMHRSSQNEHMQEIGYTEPALSRPDNATRGRETLAELKRQLARDLRDPWEYMAIATGTNHPTKITHREDQAHEA